MHHEGILCMRTFKRAVAGAITTALAVGLVTAPALSASAATHKASTKSQGVSVTLTAKDLTNHKGTYKIKDAVTVTVKVPAPFKDTKYDGSTEIVPVKYWIYLKSTGAASCSGSTVSDFFTTSKKFTFPATFKNTKSGLIHYYSASGKCKLSVEVSAYRYTTLAAGRVNVDKTVSTTYYVQSPTSLTKPSASATHVKKNHTVKLSGKATYLRADSKHWYTKTKLPKGTKLVVQKKAKGAKSWSKVATVKVTSKGTWSKTVKVAKTTSYRVVYAGGSTRTAKTSAVRVVKVG
jgi:hypothetical protein